MVVRLSELGVLAQAAAASTPGSEIIEIGTFDGRTTLNLAMNAPMGSTVFTLDLPPDHPTQFQLAPGERMFVEKSLPGERFRNAPPAMAGEGPSCNCWGIPPRSTGRNISARRASFSSTARTPRITRARTPTRRFA